MVNSYTPLEKKLINALNKLAKWRAVFAGWQLGTRGSDDPECQAIRDHREVTILLRAEVNALTKILLDKGIFTQEELQQTLLTEAELLDHDYEEKFPGIRTDDFGTVYGPKAVETMRNWKP